MIGLGLRQVQEALDRKADQVQREFIQLSEDLNKINAELLELQGEARQARLEDQQRMREQRQTLADEINLWRERARRVMTTGGGPSLRAYLDELLALDEEIIRAPVERAIMILESPEDAAAELASQEEAKAAVTPAGRLLTRARTEYDMRRDDPEARRRAAVEFTNRPGMAQDDEALAEIEAALEADDPLVREVALFTAIQMLRFRAMRFADLKAAHEAVEKLVAISHPEVIPALIEVLENPRTGFASGGSSAENVEAANTPSRYAALVRLVEWHTPEAEAAVRGRIYDRAPKIAETAERALKAFPEPWQGPLKKS